MTKVYSFQADPAEIMPRAMAELRAGGFGPERFSGKDTFTTRKGGLSVWVIGGRFLARRAFGVTVTQSENGWVTVAVENMRAPSFLERLKRLLRL